MQPSSLTDCAASSSATVQAGPVMRSGTGLGSPWEAAWPRCNPVDHHGFSMALLVAVGAHSLAADPMRKSLEAWRRRVW